jgi:hypothetical protein
VSTLWGKAAIKTGDVEAKVEQLMHQPRRHGTRLKADADILSAVPRQDTPDLLRIVGCWPRHSRRPELSMMQIAVIFCDTSIPM